MKNAKRTLAAALAGTMALSNIAMVSAAEMDTKAKLDKLMDLKIVFGDDSDKDSLNFDKDMERYRSIALMLRLTEEGSGAMDKYDYEGKETFADKGEFSTYVKRVMAYSKNNDIGIDGYEDGTLRPLTTLTDQAYAKMMLESLGYEAGKDYEWATVAKVAAEAGIIGSASEITNEVIPFGEVVEMTYDTLASKVKGEAITLGEKIGKPVVNSQLKVASVDALNLKQIKVTFTTPVEEKSATDLDNYKLDSKTASLKDGEIKLVANNAVVITLGTPAKQQEKVTLTAKGVVAENEKTLEKSEIELNFLDQTIPTVEKVEAVGNKTLKVTFSEPMKAVEKDDFTVKSGTKKLYLDEVTPINAKERTSFYVKLYNDLKEGELDVTINGASDYAGFNTIIKTEKVDVDVDKEAPVIESYKNATPNKVTLVFDGDIELNSSDVKDFYHTNSKNAVAAMKDVKVEGNEMTLTFPEGSELPEGTAYVYIGDDAIKDLWGNKNDQLMVKVDVTADKTAPVVEEVKVVSEKEITVKFDEELDHTSAIKKANYRLVDSEGKEVKQIKSVKHVAGAKEVSVMFKEALKGDHTLFIEEVEDLSGNEVKTEIEFNVNDLTAPVIADFTATVYESSDSEQTLRVNFGERMAEEGNYSISDLEKYIVVNGSTRTQLSKIDDASVEVVDGGKAVEITVPTAKEDGVDINNKTKLEIGRVADAAGNKTAKLADTIKISGAGTVGITKAEATAKDTIQLTFDDKLVDVEPTEFVFTLDGAAVAISSVDVDENDKGNTVVTFNTAKDMETSVTNLKVSIDKTVADRSNNRYDEMVEVKDVDIDDKVAPEAIKTGDVVVPETSVANGTVTVAFSEALTTTNANLMATDLTVSLNGEDLKGGIDFTTTVNAEGKLVIKVTAGIKVDDEITVATKDAVNYLGDGTTVTKAFDLDHTVKADA